MRLLYSLLAATVLAAVALTACNSTEQKTGTANNRNGSLAGAPLSPSKTAATPVHGDGIKRVTKDELREALDKGTALVVDVRPAQSYQQAHIKGAIHIPLEQVGARFGELPRDKMIVTYCS